ncbi:hypothetical protein MTO96_016823 [Rhipicephalus appendiculatus]
MHAGQLPGRSAANNTSGNPTPLVFVEPPPICLVAPVLEDSAAPGYPEVDDDEEDGPAWGGLPGARRPWESGPTRPLSAAMPYSNEQLILFYYPNTIGSRKASAPPPPVRGGRPSSCTEHCIAAAGKSSLQPR